MNANAHTPPDAGARAFDKNRPIQALRQRLHANSRRMGALGDHFAAAKAGAMTAIKHDPSCTLSKRAVARSERLARR